MIGFITLPIKLVKVDPMTNKQKCLDFHRNYLATEIISYGPTFDDEYPELEVTFVAFKNGDSIHTYITEQKLEALISAALTQYSTDLSWNKQ